jgi:2'-5' RNA ligase
MKKPMEEFKKAMVGYRRNDYLLVLYPSPELVARISAIRNEFADKFDAPSARWGGPQVPLVSFSQLEMMEERILARLRTIGMSFPPFKVELKDFQSFPSHTIYIQVASKLPVQSLVKSIRSSCQRLMKQDDENKPLFILEPHITIARKLKPWQYEKGWLEYSHRHFSGRFIASSMVLLKKREGEMKYQVVEKMDFQNLPVVTKQGELFQ